MPNTKINNYRLFLRGLFLRILLATWFFPLLSMGATAQTSDTASINKAQLQLTHFLFTQVFESYFEEGDRFVVESLTSNSDRAYQYFLAKKFFTAFLQQWQRTIDRYGDRYPSSLAIFKALLNEPGFLHDNAYLLKATLGINDSYLEYGHFENLNLKSPFKQNTPQHNFKYPEDAIALGLSPFLIKSIELGYARIPFLLRVLESEKFKAPEQRSLQILDEAATMIAYEKNDRKTYFWITAFFLNNPSTKVKLIAQSILKNIGKNEVIDILADSRWFFVGGRNLWALRERLLDGLKALGKTSMAQSFGNWLNTKWTKLALETVWLKEQVSLTALSTYRAIKALNPIQRSAALSTSGHLALISYFIATDSNQSTSQELQIQQALKMFAPKEQTSLTSQSANILWQEFHPSIKTYMTESPYHKLRSYDPTPLNLLNQIKATQLLSPQELITKIDKRLTSNLNHDNFTFDYGSLFTQDEYYREFANSNTRDLRLLSMADTVNLERRKNILEILTKQTNANVQYFNQLKYDDFRSTLFNSLELMRAKHTYYYSRDSRSFIREMIGEGGNCVAIAMLQLSLLSPLWGDGEWKLGIVFKPNHVLLAVISEKRDSLIQLDNLSEQNLTAYPFAIYHPDLFLAAAIGSIQADEYLLPLKIKQNTNYASQNLDVEKTLTAFGFNIGSFVTKISELTNTNSLSAKIKNFINNPISNIKLSPFAKTNKLDADDVPVFSVSEKLGSGVQDPRGFANWKTGLHSILENLFQNKTNKTATLGLWNEVPCAVSIFTDEHPRLTPEYIQALIPLLNGTLGYFMMLRPDNDESNSICRIDFVLNQEQKNRLNNLDIESFMKLLLLSLAERSKFLSAKLHEPLSEKINTLFVHAKNSENAGVLIKDNSLTSINDTLFSFKIFQETISGLDSLVKQAINVIGSTLTTANEQSRAISIIKLIEEFKQNIGYPKIVLGLSNSQNEIKFEEAQGLSGAILSYTLLVAPFPGRGNPYDMFKFQKSLLVNSHLGLCVNRPQISDSTDFFIYSFFKNTNDDTQSNSSGSLNIQYDPIDKNKKVKLCEKNTLFDGYLNLLTANPQVLRANFLLPLAPTNFAPAETDFVQNNAWGILTDRANSWTIEIPEIQRQVCAPKKEGSTMYVGLPEIPKALCKGGRTLKKGTSTGLVCIATEKPRDSDLNKDTKTTDELNLPVCTDAVLTNNFLVHYTTEHLNHTININGKIHIPLENILALYSKHNDERNVNQLAPLILPSVTITPTNNNFFGSLKLTVKKSTANQRTKVLELADHFNDDIADHFIKNKDYYLKYWDLELKHLCVDIAILTTPFAEAMRREQLCPALIKPLATTTPALNIK